MKSKISDLRISIVDSVSDGPKIALRLCMRGRCRGRDFEIDGMGMVKIDNGFIVEAWNQWDVGRLMTQIGEVHDHPTTLDGVMQRLM